MERARGIGIKGKDKVIEEGQEKTGEGEEWGEKCIGLMEREKRKRETGE